jgi:signal transduction histidine kinase
VELEREHRAELERLALRRLPLAMGILVLFIGGALPIELHFYPGRLESYLAVYLGELAVCGIAWGAARRWPHHARRIATAWGAALGLCVAAYYPLVQADATLAMAALICLVTAMPATLPFGVGHQLAFGCACAASLIGILLWGLPMSLPWQYMFIAFLAVLTTSTIGARTVSRFRWEAFEREAILRHAHEQLRIALGRAEDTVELKTRLVANVSHELRTPLNVIVGYTDMLLDAETDRAAIADAAPRIRQYAVSLEALVSELLDLSRLTCGKIELDLADVEVRPLLEEVARGVRATLGGRSVRVDIECGVARITTDRMRLQQILTNLGTNAAKFTDEGRIRIAASADQDTVAFVVEDTGCGIAESQHETIFDAFEQGAAAAGRKSGGIGLGLAIVRQLTDVLGGSVGVVSRSGDGATFTVRLPLVASTTRAERATTTRADGGADAAPPSEPLRRAG